MFTYAQRGRGLALAYGCSKEQYDTTKFRETNKIVCETSFSHFPKITLKSPGKSGSKMIHGPILSASG